MTGRDGCLSQTRAWVSAGHGVKLAVEQWWHRLPRRKQNYVRAVIALTGLFLVFRGVAMMGVL